MDDSRFQNYRNLLAKIDHFATSLMAKYPHSFACKQGCSSCCVAGITVWRVEHDHITFSTHTNLPTTLPDEAKARTCCFLDSQGSCTVYPTRPVVCRLWGLPLAIPAGSEEEWGIRTATSLQKHQGSIICCNLNFQTHPTLSELNPNELLNTKTAISTLAAINHVYCTMYGYDPNERFSLKYR